MTGWPDDAVRDCVAKECGRPVLWTVDEWGRQRPVDPDPVDAGGYVIVEVGPDDNVHSQIETLLDSPGHRHKPHHETCGARERWIRQQSLRGGELKW
jgi:hypothetical protein